VVIISSAFSKGLPWVVIKSVSLIAILGHVLPRLVGELEDFHLHASLYLWIKSILSPFRQRDVTDCFFRNRKSIKVNLNNRLPWGLVVQLCNYILARSGFHLWLWHFFDLGTIVLGWWLIDLRRCIEQKQGLLSWRHGNISSILIVGKWILNAIKPTISHIGLSN
jgi:hypothetical protein